MTPVVDTSTVVARGDAVQRGHDACCREQVERADRLDLRTPRPASHDQSRQAQEQAVPDDGEREGEAAVADTHRDLEREYYGDEQRAAGRDADEAPTHGPWHLLDPLDRPGDRPAGDPRTREETGQQEIGTGHDEGNDDDGQAVRLEVPRDVEVREGRVADDVGADVEPLGSSARRARRRRRQ